LAELVSFIVDDTISGKTAKEVLDSMFESGKTASEIIEEKGLRQVLDLSAVEKAVDEVIAKNPTQLADYKGGKTSLFGFFVGQSLKASGGTVNPKIINEILKKKLDS
jgi:aspartyl-tRNA(Asn)/glutamyl-tRNA(Gln) amidotransferase subunit B